MSEVQFHIYRKAAFAGALLPYRIYINGRYIGTVRNGKSLHVSIPRANAYYITDDMLSSQNAVICDNEAAEYSIVIKRVGGWRTESYGEFYIKKGEALEQLPSFHWEKLFELRQSMSQYERTLALCLEFGVSITDDLQEVLASENIFEIIAALQKIGADEYHNLLLKIINNDFYNIRLPLDDDLIEQMQPEIRNANRAFWNNAGAEAEFYSAIANFLITEPDNRSLIF